MENPEMETPEIEKPSFKFPPYRRRRPLYSHSFSTFIRILSHCHHLQLHFPVQGHQSVENNDSIIQGDRSITNNEMSKKTLVIENRQVFSSQDPGFRGEHMDIDAVDFRDNVRSNGVQGNVDDINRVKSGVQGSQNGNSDCDFAALASLNNSDEQLLETDGLAGAVKSVDDKEDKRSPLERGKMEMIVKGRESDAPVSAPVLGLASSALQKTDACIGDGEISENSGVPDKSSDFLREDVVSLEKNIGNKGQVSGDLTQKERFSQNALHRGVERENKSDGLSRSGVNMTSTAIDVQMGTDNVNLVENRSKLVYYGDIVENEQAGQGCKLEFGRNRQRCGFAEVNSQSSCPKNLTLSGGSTGENTVENQCSASTEKVTNLNNKKRKWGPGSEDRKARKKKKQRMKRAEKDRKLGVKRLKLPPVTNPKTIKYCHHFVKGRCHEGEKCKFSHDKEPLTKSKACSHFARQSCMKGDDCSYDHQLSKYPCNNYLSTGSCSRGSNCMFSHDVVPVKEGSSSAYGQQSISARETSNFKKPTSRQNVNAKSCSSQISLSENEIHNGHAEQVPNGISFLSHGKVPLGSMSENGKSASSLKADTGTKVDQQRISGASDLVVSLDKNTQRTHAMPPRRVNFLSFGKAPFESSSSKRSSFSLISNLETGKPPLSDLDIREHVGSSLNKDVVVKVDSHIGGGASGIFPSLNETANKTPAMTPPVGNHLDSSVKKKVAGSYLNETDTVQPIDKTDGSVNVKAHSPSPVLPQNSSSLPGEFSLSKLIDAQCKISLNASQRSFLSKTPSSVKKAVRSTLTFAAKFESKNNKDRSYVTPAVSTDLNMEASSSQNQLAKASTILDLLFGANSKTK